MTQLLARMQSVEQPVYLKTADLLKRFGVSRTWLWRQGLQPPIKVRVRGKLLWNCALFEDWLVSQGDPEAQARSVENYLSGLPSSQPRKVGRPKK